MTGKCSEKISAFLNSENKIKAFEASWAANIVAARNLWVAHGSPPKERENVKSHSPQWKVGYERSFVFTCWYFYTCLFIYERSFVL